MNKLYSNLILFFLLLSLSAQLAQAQRETFFNKELNGTWSFRTDLYNQGEQEQWYLSDQAFDHWDEMEVPGNWDLKNEYAEYVGKAWYRRTFEVPSYWQNQNVRLVFEAVYNDAKVWINGKEIGEHHVGFLPFWFDINKYLKFGEENTMVVMADNTFKRGAIWNWGGIRRPVWLEVTPQLRLEYQHITARPDLEQGTAEISVEFEVNNLSEQTQTSDYELALFYKDQKVAEEKGRSTSLQVAPGEKVKQQVSFTLPKSNVHLWHFNHPHLYRAELKLLQSEQAIHQMQDRFGIREIKVDGYALKLNGETMRTVGFNLVPEDRTTGNTLPLWRIKQDVDMMKALGANMARLSHLPLPKEFLDYLDEKGIMTFEEVSLWGKDEMADPAHPLPKYWLEKMVYTKYNHPSVIGWSIGNEIGFVDANPKVMAYVEGAIAQAKALDPTRLAIYVSHSASAQAVDPVQYSDLILFNRYGGWGKDADKAHELHPGKPIFMAEYGNHLNSENLNEANIDAAHMLNELRGKPYMAGVSLWTFNDYRSFWKGNETWTTPPSQNRTWGIVDIFRQKKRAYDTFRKEYAPVSNMLVRTTEENKASIALEPRGKLDIPAYTLEGYTLAWKLLEKAGNLIEGGMTELPAMHPGDPVVTEDISWNEKAFALQVSLLDPQLYSVLDTTVYFEVPNSPEIKIVHTAADKARVVFDQEEGAISYKVLYGKEALDQETEPTINNYVDIDKLQKLENYQFVVVAINNAGESKPSQAVKAKLDEDELPPIIRATVPYQDHFFIGYSVDPLDYMYDIEYGTEPGEYNQHIGLRNVGVCQIPNLKAGATYYYRMRNRKQWGFASEWTHEVEVNLQQEKESEAVALKGAIRKANQVLLVFDPVERAIGYVVEYSEKGKDTWKTQTFSSSVISHALLQGLKKNSEYEFKVKAIFQQPEPSVSYSMTSQ